MLDGEASRQRASILSTFREHCGGSRFIDRGRLERLLRHLLLADPAKCQRLLDSVVTSTGSDQVDYECFVDALFGYPGPWSSLDVSARARSRPALLAQDEEITDSMRLCQRFEPVQCAMTIEHWSSFLDACRREPLWEQIQQEKGFVSIYDVSTHFVIPWTRGTGCGVAVLANRDSPKQAELMFSHAWGEDAEECQEAVKRYCKVNGLDSKSVVAWFCAFSLYQPEDTPGTTIADQIALDPFVQVIASEAVRGCGMVAIHTSKADMYSRLWCVREIDEAMSRNVQVSAAVSLEYTRSALKRYFSVIFAGGSTEDAEEAAELSTHTARARCREQDEDMLISAILSKKGGFRRLDAVIAAFRREHVLHQTIPLSLRTYIDFACEEGKIRKIASIRIQSFSRGEWVMQQGEASSFFCLIDSGELEVQCDGAFIRRLFESDFAGELSTLKSPGSPRTAGILTVSETATLLIFDVEFSPALSGSHAGE